MKVTIEQLREMIKNNEDVSNVDTSEITDMSGLFFRNNTFNQNISNWNTKKVKNMRYMFYDSDFNGNISKWDVSNVEDMSSMFYEFKNNIDIFNWKILNVKKIRMIFGYSNSEKNMFNFKKIIKNKNELYAKDIDFIKNNIIVSNIDNKI